MFEVIDEAVVKKPIASDRSLQLENVLQRDLRIDGKKIKCRCQDYRKEIEFLIIIFIHNRYSYE